MRSLTNRGSATIRLADVIGKDVTAIRGDVRGGRYEGFDPLVRTLIKCERKIEIKYGIREPWIYVYWQPEGRTDGQLDCGYSGWQEEHFNEIDPVIIVEVT